MYNWDLNRIYNGYESKEYIQDLEKLKREIQSLNNIDYSELNNLTTIKEALKILERIEFLLHNIYSYSELRLSTDSGDTYALKEMGRVQNIFTELKIPEIKIVKYIKNFSNFKEIALKDEELKKIEYYILNLIEESQRLLSDETEVLLSKLEKSSGSAWEMLFTTLTSTLEVEYDEKTITLPEVRNLAYSSDEIVRKKAYEAELNSYKRIEKPMAATISSIKEEVTTILEARGYKTPIEQTLIKTGMTKKTLDALTSSIEEYYPMFRAYLKRKGELLGHKNGLPFYDLFAPLGKVDTTYTIEEANKYLIDRFSTFNKEISFLMKEAMENEWIDYLPKPGKSGGAFCSEVLKLKESRILTNFDGSFNSVCTLAHELGHAFHSSCLWDESIFNISYPMQLAETASTFNETFIKDDAIKNAKTKNELLNILEASISDDTQVIVDIMSRFYFEKSVFEKSKESQLTSEELCELMKKAQLKSYGDGLDKNYLHPYMWCCKSHYYSTNLSFYNFPYAFGQLFAYGLYSIYKEKGDSFFTLYKRILKDAGKMPIRECVLQAGIDVESKEFWKKSLDLIKERIKKFLEITE